MRFFWLSEVRGRLLRFASQLSFSDPGVWLYFPWASPRPLERAMLWHFESQICFSKGKMFLLKFSYERKIIEKMRWVFLDFTKFFHEKKFIKISTSVYILWAYNQSYLPFINWAPRFLSDSFHRRHIGPIMEALQISADSKTIFCISNWLFARVLPIKETSRLFICYKLIQIQWLHPRCQICTGRIRVENFDKF